MESGRLKISSNAFDNNGEMAIEYTGFDRDISPEFKIENLHENTVSIAIIMDDLGLPFIKEYNHWIIWNIPRMEIIPENIPYGKSVKELGNAIQGIGYGKNRYRGPKQPIFIRSRHSYIFRFYALDCFIELEYKGKKKDLIEKMKGHILQEGEITGTYKR